MGLIDSYNFLLSNCHSSYQYFNNILSYFIENPKYYTHESIGSSTEKVINSSFSQLYLLFKSIIAKSVTFPQNSTLETMINIVNVSISKLIPSSITHVPDDIENISSQQFLNIMNIILNLLNTIASPIPIHNFQEFKIQISSLSVNEFSKFNNIIINLQNILNKIHDHLNKLKNITNIELEPNDNLLTISEKLVNLYILYESTLPFIKRTYENLFHNIYNNKKISKFNFQPHLFIEEKI
jgi:hypothetical protein